MTFAEHLKKYLADQEINQLVSSFNEPSKHAVLLNEAKMGQSTFLSLFPNVEKHPFVNNGFIYNKNEYNLGKSLYHQLGCFYLQEPSAMIVSSLLDFSENDVVLDLCAAPGGKTIQAAFKMHNQGVIFANDIARDRSFSILENIERLGIGNVIVTNNDFSKISSIYQRYFTKIILDAPCSGSGMFRKDVKMQNDWSINKVYKYAEIQKELIVMAYSMLKPGGILSYSTCSYSYEEDEEVIEHLIKNTDAELVDLPKSPFFYQSKSAIGVHLMSHIFPGEGHYIAQIKKPGILKETKNENINQYAKIIDPNYQKYHVLNFNNYIFMLPRNPMIKGLNIIRYGVKVGEKMKDFCKYDFHYGRLNNLSLPIINCSLEELTKYLQGQTIEKATNEHGYIILKYQNINVDITKTDGRIIKNHYPKGLRNK